MTYPNLVAEEDRAAFDHLHRQDEAEADRAEQEGAHAGPFSCAHPEEDHKPGEGCTWLRCGCWWVPLW